MNGLDLLEDLYTVFVSPGPLSPEEFDYSRSCARDWGERGPDLIRSAWVEAPKTEDWWLHPLGFLLQECVRMFPGLYVGLANELSQDRKTFEIGIDALYWGVKPAPDTYLPILRSTVMRYYDLLDNVTPAEILSLGQGAAAAGLLKEYPKLQTRYEYEYEECGRRLDQQRRDLGLQ